MPKDTFVPVTESIWRRVVRALTNFAEASDATEAAPLEKRVLRLERDVVDLKSRRGP
jgi:hypothetical protein